MRGNGQGKGSEFNIIWTPLQRMQRVREPQASGLDQVAEGQDFIHDQREDPVYALQWTTESGQWEP